MDRRLLACSILAALGGLLATGGAAQDDWSWPENPKNLTRLPASWPGSRLAPVMSGLTNALGVRCSHCHVGEEGQPLSTYDFASDANPKKEIARQMLDLLGVVNKHLDGLGVADAERVNMWCHTCHRGLPKPRTLGEQLQHTYQTRGLDAVGEEYRALEQRYAGTGSYDFSEPAFGWFASSLAEQGKVDDAIALRRLDLERHPDDPAVHGGLAAAYRSAGRLELARIHARRALELAPDDGDLVELVRGLETSEQDERP
jgi:tetratricopeptide (TPR) repeat protein